MGHPDFKARADGLSGIVLTIAHSKMRGMIRNIKSESCFTVIMEKKYILLLFAILLNLKRFS